VSPAAGDGSGQAPVASRWVEFWRAAGRRWPVLVACVTVGLALAAGIALFQKPDYQTHLTYFVSVPAQTTDDPVALTVLTTEQAKAYVGVLSSAALAQAVVSDSAVKLTAAQVGRDVAGSATGTAGSRGGTALVRVSVTDPSRDRAQLVARFVALSLPSVASPVGVQGVSSTPVGIAKSQLVLINGPSAASAIYPARKAVLAEGLAIGLLTGLVLMLAEAVGSLKRRNSPHQRPN